MRLHLDFAGPFLGKMYLVLIVAHSKWIEEFPTSWCYIQHRWWNICEQATLHSLEYQTPWNEHLLAPKYIVFIHWKLNFLLGEKWLQFLVKPFMLNELENHWQFRVPACMATTWCILANEESGTAGKGTCSLLKCIHSGGGNMQKWEGWSAQPQWQLHGKDGKVWQLL